MSVGVGSYQDLVLVRDVEARFALRGKRLRCSVLAPVGTWLGRGALRVLRVQVVEVGDAEAVELVLGYESYLPMRTSRDAQGKREAFTASNGR